MLTLRVLGYRQEDGKWAAHCLETDLVGYGRSFEKALANLEELTEMQIGFALFKDQPSLLERPAPLSIIETYNVLHSQHLQHYTKKKKFVDRDHKVASIPLPPSPTKTDFSIVSP